MADWSFAYQDKETGREAFAFPTCMFFGSGGRIRTDDLRVMREPRRFPRWSLSVQDMHSDLHEGRRAYRCQYRYVDPDSAHSVDTVVTDSAVIARLLDHLADYTRNARGDTSRLRHGRATHSPHHVSGSVGDRKTTWVSPAATSLAASLPRCGPSNTARTGG